VGARGAALSRGRRQTREESRHALKRRQKRDESPTTKSLQGFQSPLLGSNQDSPDPESDPQHRGKQLSVAITRRSGHRCRVVKVRI
jgi:hypothetical protein